MWRPVSRQRRAAGACPICEDERQYVNWKGQRWLSREALAERHKLVWRDDLGLSGIGLDPGFAIGQRALLIPEAGRLRDVGLRAPRHTEAVDHVRSLGGLKAIAVSHPHYYGAVADWSEAFGGVPIYLHGDDRQWVTRPHAAIVPWTGDSRQISDDIVLIRTGGHFAGGTILHWRAGAQGRGALLTGDVAMVAMDRRSLSFMYSFPNYIPLNAKSVRRHRARGRAAGVRPHLWRVVGQEHRGGRKGRIRCFGPALSGRDCGLGWPRLGNRPAVEPCHSRWYRYIRALLNPVPVSP